MELDAVIKKRESVKEYSMKKPLVSLIIKAIESANKAPFAGNLQIVSFVIIENARTIAKIADCCQQDFIKQAPYVVIVCSNPHQIKRLYHRNADTYIKHNIGAAVENFFLKIVDMGLATAWVAVFSDNLIRTELGIPENINIEVVMPVGYELKKGKTKQRFKHSLVNRVYFEQWGNKFYNPIVAIRRPDI